jgi:putative ABC transport system permease protein
MLLAGAGVAFGLAIAASASGLLGKLVYGIGSSDVLTYVSASGLLFAVALVACLIPGRRATAIDPNQALRG